MNHLKYLFLFVIFCLTETGIAQCTCEWIEKNKRNTDLPLLYKKKGNLAFDELSTGIFRKSVPSGVQLMNVKGESLADETFNVVEQIYPDSTFIAQKNKFKNVYRLRADNRIEMLKSNVKRSWYLGSGKFLFHQSDSFWIFHSPDSNVWVGSIFNQTISLKPEVLGAFAAEQFFSDFSNIPNSKIWIGDYQFHAVRSNRVVMSNATKTNFYAFDLASSNWNIEKLDILDSMRRKRKVYYFAQDSRWVYYLAKEGQNRSFIVPHNTEFTEYRQLNEKQFVSYNITDHTLIRVGKKTLYITSDTLLEFEGKMEIVDVFNGPLLLVQWKGEYGIFNTNKLAYYKLDGGVHNVTEVCPQYIVTLDKHSRYHMYSLDGYEIGESEVAGHLLGSFYFSDVSGEVELILTQ
ncbi:MAG: hypothetical protein EP332_12495 [Bacteroidetes bacterium]|nr:MAG: hypothetical protein EP332_12495 [Bacteroidota bacterium]